MSQSDVNLAALHWQRQRQLHVKILQNVVGILARRLAEANHRTQAVSQSLTGLASGEGSTPTPRHEESAAA